ncbi:helix-turn-helix domain-containing protein [Kitasatospora sp. NPDC101155]|uniref:helix-turn-helix domain-containing protein n=1 Tax=Kitasatospora sp. NPDC101155 TaxID=3364097 RepID=UPI0038036F79
MSEGAGAVETEEFARLLRELKDRSGLSYGTLAKRLHMSTSTLHRYCNGTALPHEYMPAERFARVCRATPEELVELHRSWILADAARVRRTDRTAEPAPAPVTEPEAAPAAPVEPTAGGAGGAPVIGAPVVVAVAEPVRPRRRHSALIASAAAVALLTAVMIVARPTIWGGGSDAGGPQAAGARAAATTTATATATATGVPALPAPSLSTPAASTTGTVTPTDTALATATTTPSPSTPAQPTDAPAPLTVGTRPYVYADPCSQHFLVNSAPAQVGPPATEGDAPRWAAAYGAVSSGEQQVALTVQGTGADPVVLEALHVRITAKGAPLAWNDYSMGVGCGGEVDTKSFDIDLDRGSPVITVKGGQRDFPYKVSKSDPEVFYVTAHTKAHDVRWDLTLDWSSGDRRGTIQIDNRGTPFRTSADVNRPGYDYPPGGSEWIKRTDG